MPEFHAPRSEPCVWQGRNFLNGCVDRYLDRPPTAEESFAYIPQTQPAQSLLAFLLTSGIETPVAIEQVCRACHRPEASHVD